VKWEPLKPKSEPEKKPIKSDPLNAYYDERGDDDWTEKDLSKLVRPGHPKASPTGSSLATRDRE
jgi:hypothetical protein